ncbi:AAA family ATPase [Tepidibacter formicigenes]|uniref:ATPase n=1 Tax=Tepidibacter formicigenes DSM 15518 TaxID=1123349 RepID=A0A1M6SCH8_9FIRM|nr:AAA family ATPase [Tepidibacter formicigenes]SHK42431.1 ATPase [Tepidibacter formicigenes DSM 15518]
MVKPDWNIFKAKFSQNTQSNFEWFCYLLFCQEHNRSFGIFRYKNQSAIETDPIIKENEVIGWQAKFYETTLSVHKNDLIGTITKIKRNYPNLTKVIFYTNQEWGQGKSNNDPQAKIAVEQKAKECNLEIEWRTESYFESPFVTINNSNIAQHFFSLDNSIINLLKEKQAHTESILLEIQTNIDFDTQIIEIDRRKVLKNIKEELAQKQILIVSGTGGVGKTAVIKKLYSEIKEDVPFYIFKANEFNINNINELFSEFTLKEFVEAHKEENNKIIVIDSAERLLELENTEPFREFLSIIVGNRWKILFTTRNNYLEDLNYQFIEIHNIIPLNLEIRNLTQEEINDLSQKYDFSLPVDSKLLELIKNPFYLNEYLRFYKDEENLEYLNFKKNYGIKLLKNLNQQESNVFCKLLLREQMKVNFL